MYIEYFGLRERPFSIAPDPYYLFMSEQHREALAHLLYGVKHDGGFVLLTGEVGTGKTTICRCLLEQMPEDTDVAFIVNTKLSAVELLESICQEFGISDITGTPSVKNLVDKFNKFLVDTHSKGRKTVVIIDEAQNLEMDVLEQIRLLTNLETPSAKLLQIVLLGQPELRRKLERQELRQLSQRITARYHLSPLSKNELANYINHRLSVAGTTRNIFPDESLQALYELSEGVPRVINLVCDRALLGAYSENKVQVDEGIIRKAASEVFGNDTSKLSVWWEKWIRIAGPVLIVLILIVIGLMQDSNDPQEVVSSPSGEIIQKTEKESRKVEDVQEKKKQFTITEKIEKSEPEQVVAVTPPPAVEKRVEQKSEGKQERTITEKIEAKLPDTSAAEEEQEIIVQSFDLRQLMEVSEEKEKDSEITQASELPFGLSSWKYEYPAYESLFTLWGLSYNRKNGHPCRYADRNGLRCYYGNGSLQEIKNINRPVFIQLKHMNSRKNIYITLAGFDGESAIILSGDERLAVPVQELILHWSGRYMILWRPPEGYSDSVRLGHRGKVVSWLDRSLSEIAGESVAGRGNSVFDDDLFRRLKKFQFTEALAPDGIAGILTFIHINSHIDNTLPLLTENR